MMMKIKLIFTTALFFLLVSCSSVQFGYRFADEYLKYKIADQFNLDNKQKQYVYASVDSIYAWHKSEEIMPLITLLNDIKQVTNDKVIEDEEFNRLFNTIHQGRIRYNKKIAPYIIELLATLSDDQVEYFIEDFSEEAEEHNEEDFQGTQEQRVTRRLEDGQDTLEDLFGKLTKEQIAFLRSNIDMSDTTIAKWKARSATKISFYRQSLVDHRTDKLYMTKLFDQYIDDPDFYQPENQKAYQPFLQKMRVTVPAFFALVNDQQHKEFQENLDELIDDLQSIKEIR